MEHGEIIKKESIKCIFIYMDVYKMLTGKCRLYKIVPIIGLYFVL